VEKRADQLNSRGIAQCFEQLGQPGRGMIIDHSLFDFLQWNIRMGTAFTGLFEQWLVHG
jgi:hypothetical protein